MRGQLYVYRGLRFGISASIAGQDDRNFGLLENKHVK